MRRISPFLRNVGILALISAAIVVLNQESALVTAGELVRFAFVVAIAVVAYFFWRDFLRHEIGTWPARAQWVFYGAAALLVADVVWWMAATLSGRDLLVFLVVAAVSAFSLVRTWREQSRLL